jgi:hypothetical protein
MSAPKKTWFELASEAIRALKDRTGSSQQAIKGWITSNYPSVEYASVSISSVSFSLFSLLTLL